MKQAAVHTGYAKKYMVHIRLYVSVMMATKEIAAQLILMNVYQIFVSMAGAVLMK